MVAEGIRFEAFGEETAIGVDARSLSCGCCYCFYSLSANDTFSREY